jgi:hypothetical protein
MMAKDGRSLKQCIVRCDPSVRPDLQNQLVESGELARLRGSEPSAEALVEASIYT